MTTCHLEYTATGNRGLRASREALLFHTARPGVEGQGMCRQLGSG